jgi:hypothetical protein
MLTVEFLPARFGDCILIEYGTEGDSHRVLIDGGTAGTRQEIQKRLRLLSPGQPSFDLLVITHVDRDHLEGILGLLEQDQPGFTTRDVWFNGWCHLPGDPNDEVFGAVQGERLTQRLLKLDLPWNRAFDGKAVVASDAGPLPSRELEGGLRLTLLSPTVDKLRDLRPQWEQEVREANLDPGFGLALNDEEETEIETFGATDLPNVPALAKAPFEEDESAANGSSIALLAEYGGRRLLLPGDAHPVVLAKSMKRYSPDAPVPLDLFKLPHHGSAHNVSREMLGCVECSRYAFSTNGSVYNHPDEAAVSRVIIDGRSRRNPQLIFNYRSSRNAVWAEEILRRRYEYAVLYPGQGSSGVVVSF